MGFAVGDIAWLGLGSLAASLGLRLLLGLVHHYLSLGWRLCGWVGLVALVGRSEQTLLLVQPLWSRRSRTLARPMVSPVGWASLGPAARWSWRPPAPAWLPPKELPVLNSLGSRSTGSSDVDPVGFRRCDGAEKAPSSGLGCLGLAAWPPPMWLCRWGWSVWALPWAISLGLGLARSPLHWGFACCSVLCTTT